MLPRRYGWLKRLLPLAGCEMNAFDVWLAEPDLKAMRATAPQVGRILRPLCHMMGLEMPAELRLPKRKRRARGHPSPVPSHKGRGTQKAPPMPRRRDYADPKEEARAWMAWSAATTKPVDPRRMSAVRIRAARATGRGLPAAGGRIRRADVHAAAEELRAAEGLGLRDQAVHRCPQPSVDVHRKWQTAPY
jgi:hypothetical protein